MAVVDGIDSCTSNSGKSHNPNPKCCHVTNNPNGNDGSTHLSLSPIEHHHETTANLGPTTTQHVQTDPVIDALNASRRADITHTSYPRSDLDLPDHHIDDVRSLRVTVIGAGLAGILAGILLPVKVPRIQLTILEKNNEVVRRANAPPTRGR